VLVRETPRLLLPGQYSALVVLIACLAFVGLVRGLGVDATKAALVTIALFFVVRALTVWFNWSSSALLRESSE
jgi:ribose/xylose/arabinose/galactoside ABC-type transport system permease subunit